MNTRVWIVFGMLLVFSGTVWGISAEDINRLTKAGLSGDTIQLIMKEKVVETCAFTVDELVDLKTKAKLSEKTIQMIISEGSFLKDRAPVIYGQDVKPLSLTSVDDIVKMKQAGISDDVIQAVITSGSASRNGADRDKAWQMLNNMGIVVDSRKSP